MTLLPYERAKQSILEEFEKFRSKIEPTENEKNSISISHTKMRTMLKNSTDVGIVDTFLTGSYARDTMVRPLKDVDFIVQVHYGNHKNDTPMQLLNKVSRILRSAYPQTPITITPPCITVKFSYCHFEVVPAIGFTNNEELYWNAKRFADRGKPFNCKNPTNLFLGAQYRMTELQAAIGRAQLKKLKSRIKKRQMILKKLQKSMKELIAVRLWKLIEDVEINPWFCFLHYDEKKMRINKEEFVKAVNAEGIPMGHHYVTVMYEQTWIKEKNTYGGSHCPWTCPLGRDIDYKGSCPNAEKAIADHMTLYINECWTDREIEDTVKALEKVEKAYLW